MLNPSHPDEPADRTSLTQGKNEFWNEVTHELEALEFDLGIAEERIDTIRKFFDGMQDEFLFYHQSPRQVAKAISEDGYQQYDPPSESTEEFLRYLERESRDG